MHVCMYTYSCVELYRCTSIAKTSQSHPSKVLSPLRLAKQQVDNSRSFAEYLKRIGVWNDTKNTPDHIAGVRQRRSWLSIFADPCMGLGILEQPRIFQLIIGGLSKSGGS